MAGVSVGMRSRRNKVASSGLRYLSLRDLIPTNRAKRGPTD
jgi:hypothetical protein